MIERSVFLRCTPDRAFALFTERASAWWPPTLRHTADPNSEIMMLPAGRFWEQGVDGETVELGRITAWEPPRRLVFDFFPGTDAHHPTEVVVTFAAEAQGTLVVVEHRPTSRSIALWDARAPGYVCAWNLMLAALAGAAVVEIT